MAGGYNLKTDKMVALARALAEADANAQNGTLTSSHLSNFYDAAIVVGGELARQLAIDTCEDLDGMHVANGGTSLEGSLPYF